MYMYMYMCIYGINRLWKETKGYLRRTFILAYYEEGHTGFEDLYV